MNNRAREYRVVISEIQDDIEQLSAQGVAAQDLLEADEWQALREIVGTVLEKIKPREPGLT